MSLTINARNKQNLPYNLTSDTIKFKITIFEDFNNSYLEGINVSIYANFDGPEVLIGTSTTNSFGIIDATYNTDLILDKSIATGQIWCKFSYLGKDYVSNKTRVNFIYDTTITLDLYIIDANTVVTRLSDPDNYNIIDANTVSTRLSDINDYTIYYREF